MYLPSSVRYRCFALTLRCLIVECHVDCLWYCQDYFLPSKFVLFPLFFYASSLSIARMVMSENEMWCSVNTNFSVCFVQIVQTTELVIFAETDNQYGSLRLTWNDQSSNAYSPSRIMKYGILQHRIIQIIVVEFYNK